MDIKTIKKPDFIKYFLPFKKDEIIQEFIDNILDGIIFISNNHYIKWVNQEAVNMLGYEKEELKGKNLKTLLGGNFSFRWEDFCNLLTDVPVKNHDVILRKKDGLQFPVKMNIMPFTDNIGVTTGWLVTAKDMTRTKNIIKELATSRKELQQTVKELEQSRDELIHSEKLSFAGRIAARVAHEIRNPLNIIGMAINQLHNELGQKDSRKEYTRIVINHIDRVNKLLTEFVDVTRPPKLKMKWNDVNIILDEVLKLIQPKIQERKIEVIKVLDKNLPVIRIDKDHMIQVFTNLFLNSCEALPKKRGKIWVSSKQDGNYIGIRIRNSGQPIPKKDLISIFDPFFSTKKTGTGLGMSITYSIIGSHGGTISVESHRKIGTVFDMRLPLSREKKRTI